MRFRFPFAAALALLPAPAFAQAYECRVPPVLPRPVADLPSASQPKREMPIGGYTLALSWSPEYCRTRRTSSEDHFQCGGEGPRFGFTLHGLWPDGRGKSWPQYCKPTALLPERVIRENLCATPDVQLLQHEWAKHGTCMGNIAPPAYFGLATKLYAGMRYPDMDALSRRPLTVAGFSRAFAAANPGLRADMVKLNVNRKGWLEEVWLCLGTNFRPARCKASDGGLRPTDRIRIWRGG
ncbi:ribonuclease T [Sphingomonas oleivorans]|uniref:Ribonuclease T n=1 Tax=Sphingomonas oleivorans TaxID=1735121 RepID=A0A2T5G168_9SPHN|nr:ribonuclease T [Sphingomonas oleivorans]PTQ12887.1 ribonuclease T [Sphingomonas oleivorans]